MKKIIVHADDFGLTPSINGGIIKAFKEGILTSASLIPSGDAFDDAIKLARENPGLDIGIHLTLTGERSVVPPGAIPSLVTENGMFRTKHTIFLWDYLLNRIKLVDIKTELSAQFEKVIATGIQVSHIDGHQHLHILPGILTVAVQLARKHGITGIRIPLEGIRFNQFFDLPNWSRLFLQAGNNFVCRFALKKIRSYPQIKADAFYGFFESGRMTKQSLCRILNNFKEDVIEIMCHPGIEDDQLRSKYHHWGYNWEKELEALTDPSVKGLIDRKGIRMIGYRDLIFQRDEE